MKYLFLGCFLEPSQHYYIVEKLHAAVTVSATTFQKAFLSGYNNKERKPDVIINAPDIGSWPKRCDGIYIPASQSEYCGIICENVGYYNVTYLKQWSILFSLKKKLKEWFNENKDEEVVIILYSVLYPYLKAAVDIKNEYPNVRICCIVLDLPEYFGDNNSLLFKMLSGDSHKIYDLVRNIDSFVLLTKYMKAPLNMGDRPWMLMEGIYEPREFHAVKKQPKTILYTGKLDARFGIHELVDNFSKLDDSNYRLWICGNGLDRDYVENKAKEDSRIIYYGQVKQERVFEMQREASLLINPRKPEGEYTKYSFPSKTMEYMASGTPTMMYRLPGMPEEYVPYVALFKDSSDEEMARTMEEWLNKPQMELDAFGVKARDFIMNNKTADKQIDRFMNFIKDIYGE